MCDIQTAMSGLGGKKMEISEHCVQIAALAGLTVIGVVAIVFDGSVGEAMAVAVAGAIGYFARA